MVKIQAGHEKIIRNGLGFFKPLLVSIIASEGDWLIQMQKKTQDAENSMATLVKI
jgi:hypothetical protein